MDKLKVISSPISLFTSLFLLVAEDERGAEQMYSSVKHDFS